MLLRTLGQQGQVTAGHAALPGNHLTQDKQSQGIQVAFDPDLTKPDLKWLGFIAEIASTEIASTEIANTEIASTEIVKISPCCSLPAGQIGVNTVISQI